MIAEPPAIHVPSLRQNADLQLVVAICTVENGAWNQLGGRGNMKQGTWHDRTALPYRLSASPAYAIPVYLEHIRWLRGQLIAAKLAPTPANIYLCWWKGATRGISLIRCGRMPEVCQRVENLVAVR